MKKQKVLALTMGIVLTLGSLSGCGSINSVPTTDRTNTNQQTNEQNVEKEVGKAGASEKVKLTLFTGKIETIDVMNEIIDDFNASQDRIEVAQEYQKGISQI